MAARVLRSGQQNELVRCKGMRPASLTIGTKHTECFYTTNELTLAVLLASAMVVDWLCEIFHAAAVNRR